MKYVFFLLLTLSICGCSDPDPVDVDVTVPGDVWTDDIIEGDTTTTSPLPGEGDID